MKIPLPLSCQDKMEPIPLSMGLSLRELNSLHCLIQGEEKQSNLSKA